MTPPERPEVAAGMPLATLLSNYRPGWYDPPWSWDDLEATAPSTPEPALDVERTSLRMFIRRVAAMGLCSQTHHEYIRDDARSLAREYAASEPRAAATKLGAIGSRLVDSEPRADAPPPAPDLPELVRRLREKADRESPGMDAGEYSDGYDQALDDLLALASEPRAAAPQTGGSGVIPDISGQFGAEWARSLRRASEGEARDVERLLIDIIHEARHHPEVPGQHVGCDDIARAVYAAFTIEPLP